MGGETWAAAPKLRRRAGATGVGGTVRVGRRGGVGGGPPAACGPATVGVAGGGGVIARGPVKRTR